MGVCGWPYTSPSQGINGIFGLAARLALCYASVLGYTCSCWYRTVLLSIINFLTVKTCVQSYDDHEFDKDFAVEFNAMLTDNTTCSSMCMGKISEKQHISLMVEPLDSFKNVELHRSCSDCHAPLAWSRVGR